uniref:Creatininase n=1 Tax=Hirondellea gigas TaxID=1518452 RepID=A0A6A7G852_9CRUS
MMKNFVFIAFFGTVLAIDAPNKTTQVEEVELFNIPGPEFGDLITNFPLVVIIPFGAVEQHGPHLPIGSDAILATAAAKDIARAWNTINGQKAIVAPSFNYGFKSQTKSGGGETFAGTISLDGRTLVYMTRDVVRQYASQGISRIVVMNGHWENVMMTIEGIDLAIRDLQLLRQDPITVIRMDLWDLIEDSTLETIFADVITGFPGVELEHAGVIETSLMQHYFPELVHMDRLPEVEEIASFPPYDVHPQPLEGVWKPGNLAPARGGTAEKGQLLANDYLNGGVQAMLDVFF